MIYDLTFVRTFEDRDVDLDQWFWIYFHAQGFYYEKHILDLPLNMNMDMTFGFNVECRFGLSDSYGDGRGNGFRHDFGKFHDGDGRSMTHLLRRGSIEDDWQYI
jgi:hypothetical protein